jgi:hypothetical protein
MARFYNNWGMSSLLGNDRVSILAATSTQQLGIHRYNSLLGNCVVIHEWRCFLCGPCRGIIRGSGITAKVSTSNKYMATGPTGARCQEWPCRLIAGSKLLLCSARSESYLVAAEKPRIKGTKPSCKGVVQSWVESSVLYGRLWRKVFMCNIWSVNSVRLL